MAEPIPPKPLSSGPRCPTCNAALPPPLRADGPLPSRWPHFPFCSERCRLVDLGRWLTGGYAIPVDSAPEEPLGEDETGS